MSGSETTDQGMLQGMTKEEVKKVAHVIARPTVTYYNHVAVRWMEVIEGIGGMLFPYSARFLVTPELAKDFLSRSVGNRKLNEKRVRKYAKSMMDHHWVVNNDDILFDKNGSLLNGHHRLSALIKAKMTIEMSFKFGLDREKVIQTIDEGKTRSNLDVIHIMGMKSNRMIVSAVSYLFEQKGKKDAMPREDVLSEIERHSEAALFATHLKDKPFAKNPVHAALIRAWYFYSDDRERLGKFIEVLQKGTYENLDDDSAALILRRFMIVNRAFDGTKRLDLFRKTESAIRYFMNKEKITRLYGNQEEIFPLPEELV